MSDFLLPNQQPNLPRYGNLGKAVQVLREPFAIAVLASLGIHGLLWFVLPLLPTSQPEDLSAKETVGVVELSPTEQLKLPDFANPQATLPPLNQQAKLKTSKSPAKAPTNPSLFNNSSLYNFPIIPPPPPVPFISIPNLPPIPNNSRRIVIRSPQVKTGSEVTKNLPAPPPTDKAEPSGQPSTPSTRPEKLNQEQLTALLAEGRQALESRGLYTFNKANTTRDDQLKNRDSFSRRALEVSQGKIENGSTAWKPEKLVTDLYPKDACSYQLKGKTLVGVLVQPDGKLAMQPDGKQPMPATILQSSGYKALDNSALEYVAKRTFEPNDNYRIVLFPFQFEPSEVTCPSKPEEKPAS